jgi:hypothetical protein
MLPFYLGSAAGDVISETRNEKLRNWTNTDFTYSHISILVLLTGNVLVLPQYK